MGTTTTSIEQKQQTADKRASDTGDARNVGPRFEAGEDLVAQPAQRQTRIVKQFGLLSLSIGYADDIHSEAEHVAHLAVLRLEELLCAPTRQTPTNKMATMGYRSFVPGLILHNHTMKQVVGYRIQQQNDALNHFSGPTRVRVSFASTPVDRSVSKDLFLLYGLKLPSTPRLMLIIRKI